MERKMREKLEEERRSEWERNEKEKEEMERKIRPKIEEEKRSELEKKKERERRAKKDESKNRG